MQNDAETAIHQLYRKKTMENIRIGTLVRGNRNAAAYIRQILPHGFESFAINYWQQFHDAPPALIADEVNQALDGSGAVVSALGVYGNPLGDDELAAVTRSSIAEAIDRAPDFGASIVSGFAGRVTGKPVPDSIERFKEVWSPLAERAASKNVRIAFENCTMGGNWKSGDFNIAFNPAAWVLMFDAVDADNLGLQWEPCHQICQLIDPLPQIREWGKRFFNLHGKDATVRRDIIARFGFGGPQETVWHRTPGFGDSNWADILSELRLVGYTGSIEIEGWHDPVYRGDLEMTGQVHALHYLKRCRGGDFVVNPTE